MARVTGLAVPICASALTLKASEALIQAAQPQAAERTSLPVLVSASSPSQAPTEDSPLGARPARCPAARMVHRVRAHPLAMRTTSS